MHNFIQKLRKFKVPFISNMEVYFDLGTSQTKIAIKDKGIILREPSYLGLNSKNREYIFFGSEAKSIVGKTPDYIHIIRPMINGVISDFDAEVAMLKSFLSQSAAIYLSQKLIKPPIRAITIVPNIATEIEKKAVEESLAKSGVSDTYLIDKAIATAAGCGVNILSHQPRLVIDMGGGLIESSILSSGGIINQKTLKNAGEAMNKSIYNYIYLKYGVILGEATCEHLKTTLLNFNNLEKTATIRGKSLETGLPKSVRIKTSDIKESLLSHFNQIIDSTKELIESSPPEILDELISAGIIISGGLAKIQGIDSFFTQEIQIKSFCAENPQESTVQGIMALSKVYQLISKIAYQ